MIDILAHKQACVILAFSQYIWTCSWIKILIIPSFLLFGYCCDIICRYLIRRIIMPVPLSPVVAYTDDVRDLLARELALFSH